MRGWEVFRALFAIRCESLMCFDLRLTMYLILFFQCGTFHLLLSNYQTAVLLPFFFEMEDIGFLDFN